MLLKQYDEKVRKWFSLFSFSVSISLPLLLLLHLLWKILPLHSPTLCPSVPLLCALPLFFPLHAVVCRHAGISGPQNDRPNLSALAPVTKDGRLCSVCAYDWCTSELLPTWLVITCLSTALVLLAKAWILYFCLYRTQFQTVSICNLWLLSDYNSSCLLLSLLHSFVCGCRSICVIACSCLCLLVCEWGVCRLAQLSIQLR